MAIRSVPRAVRFAHDSERRLAELFDAEGVEWCYEPVEFALGWYEDGRVASGFRPDFYLPNEGLFVELTTLRQRLVTKKNRKLRRLRELYPDVRVHIVYRRDFVELMGRRRLSFLEQSQPARLARTA